MTEATLGIVERLRGIAWDIAEVDADVVEKAASLIERLQGEVEELRGVTKELVDDLVSYIKEADRTNPNSGYSVYRGYGSIEKARALLNKGAK